VFCNSQFTKKFIDKKFGVQSAVIYPPCFSSEETPKQNGQKNNTILTVGRYNELSDGSSFKKHEFLINAFKEMVDAGCTDWELVIVTSYLPEHAEKVEEIAKTAKGYPIRILKNIAFEELAKLNQQCKIYWHAAGYGIDIAKHPELVEHFGITTVEAMHEGAVPIVVNKGGQAEIITDGENGYLWETKKDLIDKTKRVMKDTALQRTLAEAAMQRANDFTNEKFCESIHNLLKTKK
jgi:glycosyltransferase involved in cell wall biosynthesis